MNLPGYDAWKLMSPEDEQEEIENRERIRQAKEDRADDEYDRRKDEEYEKELKEIEEFFEEWDE